MKVSKYRTKVNSYIQFLFPVNAIKCYSALTTVDKDEKGDEKTCLFGLNACLKVVSGGNATIFVILTLKYQEETFSE